MALPSPPIPLQNHCSIIYNNTVYAYQAGAFQALPLQNGSSWQTLPMGVSVTGATCVLGSSSGKDLLYIVGGATNTSVQNYQGLQSYDFATNQWKSCDPEIAVTQNRLDHGSTFINASSAILIYAGVQDDSNSASAATFTLSTVPPYNVSAYSSQAPAGISPILLPWNSTHAALLGGSSSNREIWLFSESTDWTKLDVELPDGLQDISQVQASIMGFGDGSKVLQVFDESVSPNTVANYVLDDGNGSSDASSTPARKRRKLSTITRREEPPYNNSLAPTATRNGFSLAADPAGLVAITGGNNQNPIALFNQSGNSWIDANIFFDSSASSPSSSPSPTQSTISSSTSPSPSSSTTAAVAATSGGANTGLIIGATLGSVFGFLTLVILGYLLFRCWRARDMRMHKRRVSDFPSDMKQGLGYGENAPDYMPGSTYSRSGHRPSHSGNTAASAYATGGAPHAKRGLFHKQGDSHGSSKSFWSRGKSTRNSSPTPLHIQHIPLSESPTRTTAPAPVGLSVIPEPRTLPRSDEGWSQYFINDNAPSNLANMPPEESRYDANSAHTSSSPSNYTRDSRITSSIPHHSAEVQPLAFPMGVVSTGINRPSEAHVRDNDNTGELPRPSPPFAEQGPDSDQFYLESTSSGQDSWTPVHTSDKGSNWEERPISSIYADSASDPRNSGPNATAAQRMRIPTFPGVPSSNRTSQNTVIYRDDNPTRDERGLRSMASRDFAGGLRASPQPVITEESSSSGGGSGVAGLAGGGSNAVPRRFYDPGALQRGRVSEEGPDGGDMSWLNLGR
ncbi:hypothetical protein MMC25_006658 [Agyrium rufum]|nr:hypothetical protein [Agyrium rufum]